MLEEKVPWSLKALSSEKQPPLKKKNQKIRVFSVIDKIYLEGANTYLCACFYAYFFHQTKCKITDKTYFSSFVLPITEPPDGAEVLLLARRSTINFWKDFREHDALV